MLWNRKNFQGLCKLLFQTERFQCQNHLHVLTKQLTLGAATLTIQLPLGEVTRSMGPCSLGANLPRRQCSLGATLTRNLSLRVNSYKKTLPKGQLIQGDNSQWGTTLRKQLSLGGTFCKGTTPTREQLKQLQINSHQGATLSMRQLS